MLLSRDMNEVEESMAELEKFTKRTDKQNVIAGSPRIYIEEVLNIK